MKNTFILLILFCGCLSISAQQTEVKLHPVKDDNAAKNELVKTQPATVESVPAAGKDPAKDEPAAPVEKAAETVVAPAASSMGVSQAVSATASDAPPVDAMSLKETLEKETGRDSAQLGGLDLKKIYVGVNRPPAQSTAGGEEKFHWTPALVQSGIFLGLQTAFRMTEGKTRNELDGPFFRDWKESVQNLEGWDDGGKIFTNYVAHPMQGAVTGRIFVNNSERASNREFGASKNYWESRLKAMVWSAVWSTQFELGPISEASLGNVGQKRDSFGRSKMTYMDLVLTPTMGTGMLILEDAIDKYVLKNWIERNTKNSFVRHFFRVILNPTTAFANLLRGSAPWRRDNRSW